MEKENLPGNSYSSKSKKEDPKVKVEVKAEEPTKVKKVVKGEVIQKKKGIGSKIAETFTGDDAKSVGSYVLFDVIIPAAKNMLADAVSQGSERLLFGDTRSRSRVANRTGTKSYSSMYRRDDRRESPRRLSDRERSTHDFDSIVIAERGEAEEVIEQLIILIEDYDHAKVSDLYSMVGITGSYTDDKWGWTNLSTASTRRVRQGYILELPRPEPID